MDVVSLIFRVGIIIQLRSLLRISNSIEYQDLIYFPFFGSFVFRGVSKHNTEQQLVFCSLSSTVVSFFDFMACKLNSSSRSISVVVY